ncbi:siderophore-interacting protein [Kitasatospora sp. Ki12]
MTLPVTFVDVVEVRRITPRTARITFAAEELADTVGTTPDQQLKLCFPRPGQAEPVLPAPQDDPMGWYRAYLAIPEAERPLMRSFTLRRRRPGTRLVEIDFVLHGDTGPAAAWALRAAPGQRLGMVGPSALYAPPVPFAEAAAAADWVLLAGDETALPALATLVGALPAGVRALAYVEVADAAEWQPLESRADLAVHWLHRDGAAREPCWPGPSGPPSCRPARRTPGWRGRRARSGRCAATWWRSAGCRSRPSTSPGTGATG